MSRTAAIPRCMECTIRCKSVFHELTEADLEELDGLKETNVLKKGQVIFYESNQPRGVFVVHTGKVKVGKLGSNGREQIVRLARPGDILGYRSLLGGDRYSASAETLENSTVCFLPKSALFELMAKNASLSMNLIRLLSKDLAGAEQKVVDINQKPVSERVAEALLVLKEVYGVEEDGKTLNVVMTRENIANLAGTTTETAIRLLSDYREAGVIAFDKKKIRVLDLPRLIRESHLND